MNFTKFYSFYLVLDQYFVVYTIISDFFFTNFRVTKKNIKSYKL